MKKINWGIISKERNTIFGITILSIMFFHYMEDIMSLKDGSALYEFSRSYNYLVGSIGVEIFLFLSGMGLYFSMKKDSNILSFYKKRLQRILIPYILWASIYWPVKDFVLTNAGIKRFVLDYTLLSFWTHNERNYWFVSFIIVAYFLFPVCFYFLEQGKLVKNIFFICLVVGSVFLLPALKEAFPDFYKGAEIALWRFPIFIAGAYFGSKIMEKADFSLLDKLFLFAGVVFKGLDYYGWFNKLPYRNALYQRIITAWFSIFVIVFLAILFSYLPKGIIRRLLIICGAMSLELYMTHVNIRKIMKMAGYQTHLLKYYCAYIVLAFLYSLVLHILSELLIEKIKN